MPLSRGFAAVDRSFQARSGGFHVPRRRLAGILGPTKLKVAISTPPEARPVAIRGAYCAGEHFIIDLHGATRLDDVDHIEATQRRCRCIFITQT